MRIVDGKAVLEFEWRLQHPAAEVWAALTEPAELHHWFPADMQMRLEQGATIRFVFRDNEGPTQEGEITELDPPRVFAYTWGSDLRWEVRPEGDSSLLQFSQRFDDRSMAAKFAAGWETCVDALKALLAGGPQPPSRMQEYLDAYSERFAAQGGVEDQGGADDKQPAIVAAVVTNGDRVLLEKKKAGDDTFWAMPVGPLGDGETPQQRAVRQVADDTGLRVEVGEVIAERDHPDNGRHMIYVDCRLDGTATDVGSAETAWCTLAEFDDRVPPGIYPPVRDHIAASIGG